MEGAGEDGCCAGARAGFVLLLRPGMLELCCGTRLSLCWGSVNTKSWCVKLDLSKVKFPVTKRNQF